MSNYSNSIRPYHPPETDSSSPASDQGETPDNLLLKEMIAQMESRHAELEARASELLQARQSLQQTMVKYQDLYDSAPVGYLSLDKSGQIVEANLTLASMLGLDRDTLVGNSCSMIFSRDSLDALYLHIRRVLNTRTRQTIESQLLKQDKSLLHVRLDSIPAYSPDGQSGLCRIAVIDITEKKQMEETLRLTQEQFTGLLNAIPIPVSISSYPEQKFIEVNNSFLERSGFERSQIIGRTRQELAWKDKSKPSEITRELLESGKVVQKEIELYSRSGELHTSLLSSRRIKLGDKDVVVSASVDITGLKQAAEQIKANELELQSILDSLAEGVSLIRMDGTIARANKTEASLMGLGSPAERRKHRYRNLRFHYIHPDGTDLPLEESSVIRAIKKKRIIHNHEVGVVKDDGSTIWLSVSAVPIKNQAGEITGVVRTAVDITEQKLLQDEKELFTRRLLAVQEEERKRISRELHDDTAQYLALLKLEMDALVEKNHQIPPETLDHLKKLQGTVNRTLDEVRRFSHELRPSVLEHFGLAAAIELIITEFNNSCNTDVKFTLKGDDCRLPDDTELALFRITQEALSNIRKHAGAETAVVTLNFSHQKVRLTIADNGQGFTVDRKKSTPGRGSLGLIGMRERARLIGASLRIKSRPGAGTLISVVTDIL
jgi:PAS domain S-box-containing protein